MAFAGGQRQRYQYDGWAEVARAGHAWRKRRWHEMKAHAAHLQAAGLTHHDRATGGVIPLLHNLSSRPHDPAALSVLGTRLDMLGKTLALCPQRHDTLS